jgi:hypothetical protein
VTYVRRGRRVRRFVIASRAYMHAYDIDLWPKAHANDQLMDGRIPSLDRNTYVHVYHHTIRFFNHLKETSTRHRKESPTHNFFLTDN